MSDKTHKLEGTLRAILLEMEIFRQIHEHDPGCVDWAIRVCQAIVAKEYGYTPRTTWSDQIYAEAKEEAARRMERKRSNLNPE